MTARLALRCVQVYSFLAPSRGVVGAVVREKELRLREGMALMGERRCTPLCAFRHVACAGALPVYARCLYRHFCIAYALCCPHQVIVVRAWLSTAAMALDADSCAYINTFHSCLYHQYPSLMCAVFPLGSHRSG